MRIFDLSDLRQGAIARALTDGTGYFALPLAALVGSVLPESFTLGQNYPNPFNPSTLIPYQLAASAPVRLEVFNLLGQRITTLVDGERPAGFHTATWTAVDGAGRAAGAGVYIYRMMVGVESQTGRMVLLDGQAGVAAGGTASVMPGASGIGGSDGADAQVYGLIVSGSGLVPYVDSSFRVEGGMAPVELVVSSGQYSAGKATDDDCAFCDLFGTFNDQQEEEEDETEEEEAETDSTASEGGPDLIVQSPSVSAVTLTPGQEFTLNVTVHNQGDEQAAATMLHYYRSNNATITSSDTEEGTDAVGALDASATSAKSIALTAPTGGGSGVYYGACVASVSGESNTDNNCSSAVRITVSEQEVPEEEEDDTPEEEEDDTPEEEADGQVVMELSDSLRFNIELRFHDSVPQSHWTFYRQGAARWEEIILGDLPDAIIPHQRTGNNSYHAPYSPELIKAGTPIEDLIVTVTYDDAIRGTAIGGPTWIRPETKLPMAGFVVVDGEYMVDWWYEVGEVQASFDETINAKAYAEAYLNVWLYETAVHEIGHVLGIGTIWNLDDRFHYDTDPMKSYFAGEHAVAAFSLLEGVPFTGNPVPVYRSGHWNGRIIPEARMSNNGMHLNYISTVTVAALADLGYEVDFTQGHSCELFNGIQTPEFLHKKLSLNQLAMYERYDELRDINRGAYIGTISYLIQEGLIEKDYLEKRKRKGAGKAIVRPELTHSWPVLSCGVR